MLHKNVFNSFAILIIFENVILILYDWSKLLINRKLTQKIGIKRGNFTEKLSYLRMKGINKHMENLIVTFGLCVYIRLLSFD